MATEHTVKRNHGHPGYGYGNWDVLEVKADSEVEMTVFIQQAAEKFWKVWSRDNTVHKLATLFKPNEAKTDWKCDFGGANPIFLTK